jgi:hypothetical protein
MVSIPMMHSRKNACVMQAEAEVEVDPVSAAAPHAHCSMRRPHLTDAWPHLCAGRW